MRSLEAILTYYHIVWMRVRPRSGREMKLACALTLRPLLASLGESRSVIAGGSLIRALGWSAQYVMHGMWEPGAEYELEDENDQNIVYIYI